MNEWNFKEKGNEILEKTLVPFDENRIVWTRLTSDSLSLRERRKSKKREKICFRRGILVLVITIVFERLTDAWRAEPIKSSRASYRRLRVLFSIILLSLIFFSRIQDRSFCTRRERMEIIKKSIAVGDQSSRTNSFHTIFIANFFDFSSFQLLYKFLAKTTLANFFFFFWLFYDVINTFKFIEGINNSPLG